jgi:hypothetical protein
VSSAHTCNLKNVLGPIYPDSFTCFTFAASTAARIDPRLRQAIRNRSAELNDSSFPVNLNAGKPLLLEWRVIGDLDQPTCSEIIAVRL